MLHVSEGLRYRPTMSAVSIELPPSTYTGDSVLAFSSWKAGSSLLFELLRRMCRGLGIPYVGIDGQIYSRGLAPRPVDIGSVFHERGYCYGDFRSFPHFPVPILDRGKAILLVRDPRDVMVSLYFSISQSHSVPKGGGVVADQLLVERAYAKATQMDEWIRESCGGILMSLDSYFSQGFARRSNVAIYRYEDVIFNKQQWVSDMAEWYGWDMSAETIRDVVAPHDIVPQAERPDHHIRQVHPGNYKAHLSTRTQQRIEVLFRPYMEAFGYC